MIGEVHKKYRPLDIATMVMCSFSGLEQNVVSHVLKQPED